MDPISQGALGATFAQSTSKATRLGWVTVFGCAAGLAPDLDIFINSDTDPLLFLEYHRQFSHSLVFIPVGALLVALALYFLPRQTLSFPIAYGAALAGYATHGLLDACTSYGTQLFWPFSNARIGWNNVSIIDPLFTLPIVVLTVWSVRKHRRGPAMAAMAWALTYLGFGAVQHLRVADAAHTLAVSRGHQAQRWLVKPAFGNLLLWKTIYLHDGVYYVDALRAMPTIEVCGGSSIAALQVSRDLPQLQPDSQQAQDLERFRAFSMGYLARLDAPSTSSSTATSTATTAGVPRVIDVRYSNVPSQVQPMWGIELDPNTSQDQHVRWWARRSLNEQQRLEYGAQLSGDQCRPAVPAFQPARI